MVGNIKKYYKYDIDTGQFIKEVVEPMYDLQGNLVRGYTEIAPPKLNSNYFFDENLKIWKYKVNNIGVWINKLTGEKLVVNDYGVDVDYNLYLKFEDRKYKDILTGNIYENFLILSKKTAINQLKLKTSQYIEQHYPDIKQKSDLADKEYFETYLKIHNIDEMLFRQALVQATINISNSTSDFQTELNNLITLFPVPETAIQQEWNFAIEQLLKVSVRVKFVQDCKAVYRKFKMQIENATTESELPDLNNIFFPEFPL